MESSSYYDGLYMQSVPGQGTGVFTHYKILTGDTVLFFAGEKVPVNRITDFTHYLQIAPELYLSPSRGFDDYINHNCDPNCAVYFENDEVLLRAIRNINPNEQISFDYGTIMLNEPTWFYCQCKSEVCRKKIGNFHTMPEVLLGKYLKQGMIPLLTKYTKEELGFPDIKFAR